MNGVFLMILSDFLVAYGFIFLSELGDKTQLMTISLQVKYKKPWVVLIGIILGLTLVMAVGLIVGLLLRQTLEPTPVKIVAGFIFLAAAVYQLKEIREDAKDYVVTEKSDDTEKSHSFLGLNAKNVHIIMKVTSLMFLAELGDKTQIVFISLVASQPNFILTTLGGLLALISVNVLGILFADVLIKYINIRVLNWIVFVLFVVFGVLLLAEALNFASLNFF